MELRHLRYFIAVAEELNFGKAAQRLNMSQPPLSKQIAQLEQELEVELFSRTKRHTELTPAGKYFLEQAYEIMNKLEKTCNDIRKIHYGEKGILNIGYTGILSKKIIQLIRTFHLRYPKVEVVLQHLSTSNQIQALHDKKIKLGFLCPPIESSNFNSRLVVCAPFMVALPSTHFLAKQDSPIDISTLNSESFIMTPRKSEPGYFDTIISICNRAGFSPKVIQEAEGIFTILTLISAGMDLSLVWRKDEESPIVDKFLSVFNEIIV